MIRRALDALYRLSGVLGALAVVAVCTVVLAQVSCNVVDKVSARVGGGAIGLVVPSYAEFAGFFLASASFLALASTFRAGGHVRVVLALQRAPAPLRPWLELWSLALGAGAAGFFAWHAIRLAAESYRFGDVSPGLVPIPLWLPQTAMAFGLTILTIALVDGLQDQVRRSRATTAAGPRLPPGELARPRPAT